MSPWAETGPGDLKKIFFQTKATDSKAGLKSNVGLDPWVASLGFGYRF